MIQRSSKSPCGARSGMALVVVLGLISMLLISGVTFAVMMRVNRAGSANARSAAVARQMTMNALSYAIAAIDHDIGDDSYPYWFDEDDISSPYWRTEDFGNGSYKRNVTFLSETFGSIDYDIAKSNDVAEASIMDYAAEAFLPPGTRYKASAVKFNGHEISRPEWVGVRGLKGNGSGDIVGRYAFMAFNTTGLLDLNSFANNERKLPDPPGKRWMGQYATEISLPDDYFKGKGDIHPVDGGYGNIGEFIAAHKDDLSDNANFSTFSYSPYDPENDPRVMIGGLDVSKLKNKKADIIAAFKDSGLDDTRAKWAYLGLLDYVNDNVTGRPAGESDKERYGRPVAKMMPLFNGYEMELKITRREIASDYQVKDSDGNVLKTVKVYSATNSEYEVECVKANVVFADRQPDNPYATDVAEMEVEAKLGVFFSGSISDAKEDNPIAALNVPVMEKKASFIGCDGVLDFKAGIGKKAKVENLGPNQPGLNENLQELDLNVVCAGKTLAPGRSFPLSHYNDADCEDYWMRSMAIDLNLDSFKKTETGTEVFADTGMGSTVKLCEWTTNIVVWAETLDPRYGDERMMESGSDDLLLSGAYITNVHVLGDDDEACLTYKLRHHAATKKYFEADGHEFTTGPFAGYSNLQEELFTNPDVIRDCLHGYVDGVYLGEADSADDFLREVDGVVAPSPWNSLFAKMAPVESVGELGYLPIGMNYTVRLFDHDDAGEVNPGDAAGTILEYNKLPDFADDPDCKFHKVLDNFAASESTSGLVNLNTTDTNALAAVFFEMPVDTENGSDSSFEMLEDNADVDKVVTRFLKARNVLSALYDDPQFTSLSQVGYMYLKARKEKNGNSEHWEVDGYDLPDDSFLASEAEREAVIRNSCGLFTTRGQTFLVIMRGDAFTPRFGMSGIKSGTVHASRMALAQIWRDSVADADGNHPCFVRFFKMLEE